MVLECWLKNVVFFFHLLMGAADIGKEEYIHSDSSSDSSPISDNGDAFFCVRQQFSVQYLWLHHLWQCGTSWNHAWNVLLVLLWRLIMHVLSCPFTPRDAGFSRTLQWDTDPSALQLLADSEHGWAFHYLWTQVTFPPVSSCACGCDALKWKFLTKTKIGNWAADQNRYEIHKNSNCTSITGCPCKINATLAYIRP